MLLDTTGVHHAFYLVNIGDNVLYRGSTFAGKLSGFFPARFLAFAFLAVGYLPPQPQFDPVRGTEAAQQLLGYIPWGYISYFADDESAQKMEANVCISLSSLILHLIPLLYRLTPS